MTEEAREEKAPSEFDNPWKEALEGYFESFAAFFFPAIHAEIDWGAGHVFLDKELEKVVRDADVGRRYADKLVKVRLRDGRGAWILVHVEIQGYRDADFPKRMFVYHYRILDRYNTEVASLAVLADDEAGYRPGPYRTGRWGCELEFRFPVVKVLDYERDWEALERDPSPFAVVVMAHLKARSVKGGDERVRWKLRIARLLYERGYERKDVLELFRFVDWLLALPKELDELFWRELARMEEEKKMPYVTSVERLGREKGFREGMQQGMQQGMRTGSLEEAREMVLEAVGARFGVVPEDVASRVKEIQARETLRSLLRQAIARETLEDFRKALDEA